MINILLVEDDNNYRNIIKEILIEEGYNVDAVSSAIEAIQLCAPNKYDLVVSDLHLEKMDGLDFLSVIKKMSPNTKTMLLTGMPSEESELITIEQNIDLYLSKDRSMSVITKYIHRLLEDKIQEKSNTLVSNAENISVNLKNNTVLKNNVPVYLVQNELNLLVYFLQNRNRILSRDEIITSVWSEDVNLIDQRIVDVYVRYLRHKLSISAINSIRGVGYEWIE